MGWYDEDRENRIPAWAMTCTAWFACVAAPVVPAGMGMGMGLYSALAPGAPPILGLAIYGGAVLLTVLIIKPWAIARAP